ncbi:hypothetical protein ACTHGN_000341 [Pseudomonas putida]
MSKEFEREDRYIVIKRSDLAKVPVNYRSALVEPVFHLQAHLPNRECLVIESDWPEYEQAWAAIKARVTGEPPKERVGSGQFNDDDRYLLCREELRECEDERSALSDEARGLRDRAAKLDALLAEALLAIEGGCHAVSLPERISAALSCDDEQDPPSGYFFDTGPYQVELGEEQWVKALSVFDNYTQGNQDTFVCPGDNLRGLVSEILIGLGLAPAVD